MASYKALQNKAMHKGAYIAYAHMKQVDGTASYWMTNGQIMVRYQVAEPELKALKGQQDLRNGNSIDMTFVLDKINKEPKVAMANVGEEWTNEAGLELITATGFDQSRGAEIVTHVQGVYVDYVVALFSSLQWYVTDYGLFAVDNASSEIVAVIAKAKQVSKQAKKVNEEKRNEQVGN